MEASDPRLTTMTPPNHFNCRSVLTPIVEGQDYKTDWGNKGFKTVRARDVYNTPAQGFGGTGGVQLPKSIREIEGLKQVGRQPIPR